MLSTPLVTVCVPTYNGAAHLTECLDSVRLQTYRHLEILVVDDSSTDHTVDIAADYQKRDSRLRFVRNESNLGLVENWERCVSLSSGEYIKFAFQDDVLYPRCVEALLGAMRDGVRFAFCAREFIANDEPSRIRVRSMDRARRRITELFADHSLISPEVFCGAVLRLMPTNIVGEPTVTLMHRDVFGCYGRFNPDLLQLLDLEFWCRVGANEPISFVPEVLAKFRVHAASATSQNVARRSYRVEFMDPLLLLHEFAFSPTFDQLRDVASKRSPPIDLVDLFYEKAYRARRVARDRCDNKSNPDRSALEALQVLGSRYPALIGRSPLKYMLAREWRSLKGRLRRTESSRT